jgi:hypothetical protein
VSLHSHVWGTTDSQHPGKQQKESRSYVQQRPTLGNK